MRLYLINPRNPLVSLVKKSRWSKYCVWKPLGLLILAGLTPPEWEIKIIDENLDVPDYDALPRVLRRIWRSFRRRRGLLLATVSNLSFRRNLRADPELHEKADVSRGQALDTCVGERSSHSEAAPAQERLRGSSLMLAAVASHTDPYSAADPES